MNNVLFIIVYILSFQLSIAQDYKAISYKESIWVPPHNLYVKSNFDTSLTLIFQTNFNDTVCLYNAQKLLFKQYYKTNKQLSVVPYFYKIEKESYQLNGKLRIEFSQKKEYLTILMKEGCKFCYITKDVYGNWFVEYSEYRKKFY